jgi:putative Ca2+/H+ antiporter (TMEM165/GDT1 family)
MSFISNKSNDSVNDKIIQNIQNSSNLEFMHTCFASFSVIVFSEIGDRTFIFAAVMSMYHSIFLVYIGTMSALAAMTVISTVLGYIAAKSIPRILTHYLSIILFTFFGTKMLIDSYYMLPNDGTNEYEKVQHEIEKVTHANNSKTDENDQDKPTTSYVIKENYRKNLPVTIHYNISPIFIQIFSIAFLSVRIE